MSHLLGTHFRSFSLLSHFRKASSHFGLSSSTLVKYLFLVWKSFQYCLGYIAGVMDLEPFDEALHEHYCFLTPDESRYILTAIHLQTGNKISAENIQCLLDILSFNLSWLKMFTCKLKHRLEQEIFFFQWSLFIY